MVKGTNIIIFIPKTQVPKYKKVTYGKIVCKVQPEKEDKEQTRLTVGRNLLDLTGNLSAPTASVATTKCVFNSVVSTPHQPKKSISESGIFQGGGGINMSARQDCEKILRSHTSV